MKVKLTTIAAVIVDAQKLKRQLRDAINEGRDAVIEMRKTLTHDINNASLTGSERNILTMVRREVDSVLNCRTTDMGFQRSQP